MEDGHRHVYGLFDRSGVRVQVRARVRARVGGGLW